MTRCGFELEVSAGATRVLAGLNEIGLTNHPRLHAYHCGCDECQPRPLFGGTMVPTNVDDVPGERQEGGYLFKAQQDCTANGEFITGILEYGSPEMDTAIVGLGSQLLRHGGQTQGNVGNHVHVESAELNHLHSRWRGGLAPGTPTVEVAEARCARLYRLFARYSTELQEIAAGPRPDIRQYNGIPQSVNRRDNIWNAETVRYGSYYSGGSLMSWKSQTVEFRLWNAVRAPWRIRTHVGLSVAMLTAAVAGCDTTPDSTLPLEDVIGEHIDSATWAGILRQRYSKGGLRNA